MSEKAQVVQNVKLPTFLIPTSDATSAPKSSSTLAVTPINDIWDLAHHAIDPDPEGVAGW